MPETFPSRVEQSRSEEYGSLMRERRDSMGGFAPPARSGAHPSSALPPPPPSSLFHVQHQASDRHRDTSNPISASATSTMYNAVESPAPPPPPYGVRTMRPPTSPQNPQPPYGQSISSRPSIPLPPSFTRARDPPALPTSRPESSMSISSMLGSDTGQPLKEQGTKYGDTVRSHMNGSFSSPIHSTAHVTSPTRRAVGHGPFRRRSPSPTDQQRAPGIMNRPFRAYSNESHPRAQTNSNQHSSARSNYGAPAGPTPQQTQMVEPGSGQPLKFSHHRQSSTGKASKRPTSQPAGYANTHQPAQLIHQPRSSNTERWRDLEVARKYGELAQEATQRFKYGPAERKSQEFLDEQIKRAREETAAIISSSRKSPKFGHQAQPPPRLSVTTNPTTDRFRSEIESVEQVYNHDPRDIPPTTQSPFSPDSLRRSREEKKALKGPAPPDLSQPIKAPDGYSERQDALHRPQYPSNSNMSTNMTKSGSTNGVEYQVKGAD
ncbi:MAG: hypothetical protein Q9174_005155, partial [Haloplaca sp. 1 TL-2023]